MKNINAEIITIGDEILLGQIVDTNSAWIAQQLNEIGINISMNRPKSVDIYLHGYWDYVITVCDDANETCPVFSGKVKHRLHIGIEDPSKAKGPEKFIMNEFRRIRDEIHEKFYMLYLNEIRPEI